MSIKELIMLIFILALLFGGLITLFTFIITKFILVPYKRLSYNMDVNELIVLLDFFIHKEIDLYERDIFNETQYLTNANIENYYKDLSTNILSNIPKPYMDRAKYILSEDYIASIVTRTVMNYLKEKIMEEKI